MFPKTPDKLTISRNLDESLQSVSHEAYQKVLNNRQRCAIIPLDDSIHTSSNQASSQLNKVRRTPRRIISINKKIGI